MMGRSEQSSPLRKKMMWFATFGVMGVLVVGTLVLAFYAQNRQKSYDDASKAYLPGGGVAQITLTTPPNPVPAAGTAQKIALRFSTQRAPISALQVVVDVKKPSGVNVSFVSNDAGNFFMFAKQEEQLADGVRFQLAFGSNPLTSSFNNDVAYRDLGHFQYTQPSSGEVLFTFQPDTRTIAAESGDDTLAKPNPLTLVYPAPASQLAQNTQSPTPTPTTSSQNEGVGGTSNQVLQCNDSCTSTAQCPVNTFCSSGRCRNTACPADGDCVCSPSPTPTANTSSGSTGTGSSKGSGSTGSTAGSGGSKGGSTTGSSGSAASGSDTSVGGAIIPPTGDEVALDSSQEGAVEELRERYAEQQAASTESESNTEEASGPLQGWNIKLSTLGGIVGAVLVLILLVVFGRRKKKAGAVPLSQVKPTPQAPSTPTSSEKAQAPFTMSFNEPPKTPQPQAEVRPLTPSENPVVPLMPQPPENPPQER